MSVTFYKIMKVIRSCESEEHFYASQRMLNLFANITNNKNELQYLQKWLNKRKRLKQDY